MGDVVNALAAEALSDQWNETTQLVHMGFECVVVWNVRAAGRNRIRSSWVRHGDAVVVCLNAFSFETGLEVGKCVPRRANAMDHDDRRGGLKFDADPVDFYGPHLTSYGPARQRHVLVTCVDINTKSIHCCVAGR